MLRWLAILAVLTGLTYVTAHEWHGMHAIALSIPARSQALSLLAATAAATANMLTWRCVMADVGHPIPVPMAARIVLIGQLGKYMPGSVWAYVMQLQLGRQVGVPRRSALLSTLASIGITVTAALLFGLIAEPRLLQSSSPPGTRATVYVALALAPMAVICVQPWILNRLLLLVTRLIGGPRLRLTWRGIGRAFGWAVIGWLCYGVHLWLLAGSRLESGVAALAMCTGLMSIAMVLSLFAVFLPAGVGVREAILVAGLAGSIRGGVGAALAIALVSRLIFTLADMVAAGCAALTTLWSLRRRVNRFGLHSRAEDSAAMDDDRTDAYER